MLSLAICPTGTQPSTLALSQPPLATNGFMVVGRGEWAAFLEEGGAKTDEREREGVEKSGGTCDRR